MLPKTDWTLVEQAGDSVPPDAASRLKRQQEAMQALLVQYMPALRAHLESRWSLRADGAEELLQAFLAAKVVEDNLIGQARREKGRFRNFIRRTLDDFVVSDIRYRNAKKRSPGQMAPLDSADVAVAPGEDPRGAFEKTWAREVIALAIERMMAECEESGRADIWGVFEHRTLLPALEGGEPMPYEQLVQTFSFQSPLQAANILTTAKRMFERSLRAVLLDYIDEESDLDREIADLRAILAGGSA